MGGKSELIDIAGQVRHETPGAYLFFDGKKTEWVPKSQCEWDEDEGVLTLPTWLAKDKGFI